MFLLEAIWNYQTQTSVPPPAGALRTDDVSTMWIHKTDAEGFDRSIEFLLAPDIPFDILVRDTSGHSRRWTVTAMVDAGDYMTLTVEFVAGSVTPPANNADALVQWLTGEEEGPPAPTPDQTARLAQAVIQKATRILVMAEAPLGAWGEPSEFGMATVRPDYQIRELLFGMHLTVDVDVATVAGLVTADDVIRNGLQLDPASVPTARKEDVDRCIQVAADWIVTDLEAAFGVA